MVGDRTKHRFERYRPELRTRLLELQSHLWGTDRDANDRYFAWKYEENPYLDEPLIHVAMADGEAAAMTGAYGARWIDGTGASIAELCVGDLVVRPQDRNRFLAQRVMQAQADDLRALGYRNLLALSANRFSHLLCLRQGWTVAVEHSFAERQSRRPPLVRLGERLREITGNSSRPSMREAFDRAGSGGSRQTAISIEAAPRSVEMADLCARAARPLGGVRHARDERFFAWRFRNPLARYRFLYWHEASTLAAHLVVHQRATDRGRIALVDWAFVSTDAMTELVRTALDLAKSWSAVVSLGGCSETEVSLLRRAGFVERAIADDDRFPPGLLVKRLAPRASRDDAEHGQDGGDRWSYHLIDGDAY